jgi:hypothetical protein
MSTLRSRTLKLASEFPVGDPTRKKLLAALSREARRPPGRNDWKPGKAKSESQMDYLGYAGDDYYWEGGPVAGSKVKFHIEIGPSGRGDLMIHWSGAWFKTTQPSTLQNLQSLATTAYKLMDENDVGPALLEAKGRSLFRMSRMATGRKQASGFDLGTHWQHQSEDGRWYDVRFDRGEDRKLAALFASAVKKAWPKYLRELEQKGPDAINEVFGHSDPDEGPGTFIGDVFHAVYYSRGGIDDLSGIFTGRMGDDANKEPFELRMSEQLREQIERAVGALLKRVKDPAIKEALDSWRYDLRATYWD